MAVHSQTSRGSTLTISLIYLVVSSLNAQTQAFDGIEVHYSVLANQGESHRAAITLVNTGSDDIDTGSQALNVYPCFIRYVIGSTTEDGFTVPDSNPSVVVKHLDGCAHKIVYSGPFKLAPGGNRTITVTQKHWNVAYTDNMKNWYIQIGNGSFSIIPNTNTQVAETSFVEPYNTESKYLRTPTDKVTPLTLEERYSQQTSSIPVSEEAVKQRLIPDIFDSLDAVQFTGKLFLDMDIVSFTQNSSLSKDQFQFEITANASISVQSSQDTALLEKTKTILKMLLERFDNTLPIGTFTTKKPRFGYRGFMLDLARHFHDKAAVMRQLRVMARYQLNTLHLHLADDESWSIEIEDIPELTQYGSRQCYDLTQCATYPQLGRDMEKSQSSYLSKADYIEIIQYASSLGITILPEIELPGHSTAAVRAMKLRHLHNQTATPDYRLHDPNDTSEYFSVQSFTDGAMNPCVDTTFDFITTVIQNIKRYHTEAGHELTMIHLAGDEVADHAWSNSTACEAMTSSLGVNATEGERNLYIKGEMLKRIGVIAGQERLDIAFWEDGLMENGNFPFAKDIFPASIDVYAFVWQTVWEWWGGDRAFNLANADYKVIMTPATRFYLDFPQEPHPMERGYYWAARYINLLRAFSFRPINYYANIDGPKVMGGWNTQEEWCNPDKCPPLNPGAEKNIVGVEAPLFGETISADDHIDNNAWPRLLAVAERAWNEAAWEHRNGSNPKGLQEDFKMFVQSVAKYEIPYLDANAVSYHISPPGATKIKSDEKTSTLKLSVEFGGQRVWVRKENEDTLTEILPPKELEYTKGSRIYLVTSNADDSRRSYEVSHYEPTSAPAAGNSSSLTQALTLLICVIPITMLMIR